MRKNMLKQQGVSIITPTIRKACIPQIIDNFKRQTLAHKELIILINHDEINKEDIPYMERLNPTITILKFPQSITLGACLNEGIKRAHYNYIAKVDDDDYYGSHYLSELLGTFQREQCDVVCKKSIFYYFKGSQEIALFLPKIENRTVPRGAGATIALTKQTFEKVPFSFMDMGSDTDFFKHCREKGLTIYSSSCYHYLCIREADCRKHTWQISEAKLKGGKRSYLGGKMTLEAACKFVEQENILDSFYAKTSF